MTKHICHIITRFINGGAEENTLLTCNYSAGIGDKVTLIIGSDYDNEILSKLHKRVKLIKINTLIRDISLFKDLLTLFKLIKILKKINPDIVHTHESKAGIIGRISARLINIKLIIHTVHILPFTNVNFFKAKFYIFLEKIVSNITHKFICVSKGMMKESLKNRIGSKKNYLVIHSGFNLQLFKKAKKNYNLINLKNYRINPKKYFVLLMIGAFEERKRQIEFLYIFKKLLDKNPNLILIFVGSGKLLKEAKKISEQINVNKNVYFAGFRKNPENFISLADICIMNSIREGLPRVVPQYLAGGKPVISTNLPGISEIIKNNKNGFIVNMNKSNDLKKKIELIINDKRIYKKMCNFVQKTDLSNWSHKSMPRKINDVYTRLLK